MLDLEGPLHPRPQMERKHWIDLRGPWGFAYDDQNEGLSQHWENTADVFARQIIVPFPPESEASGIGDPSFHPIVWYRRTFTVSAEDVDKRLILHFGAVDYRSQVWVNGQLVASHQGGHTPFSADVTDALSAAQDQNIVVRAEDMPADLSQPRGKQDWQLQPHAIWYPRTTGIWQPVWIEPVSDVHVVSLRWRPDLDRAVLGFALAVQRRNGEQVRVRVQLSLHNAQVADDIYEMWGMEIQRDLSLDLGNLAMNRDEVLWSPDRPNLVHAVITLYVGEDAVDQVFSYAGLRSVGVAGGRFLLNGQPRFLRLALEQGYWPQSLLAAPSDHSLRREVELAKELGFNGIRIHQKVEDPRFLYWCDRLGLMVWAEMANAYAFSPAATERLTLEWIEVLNRDVSHPCIITWVPLNESWGVPNLLQDPAQRNFVQALYYLTKSFDLSRPVVGNDGWEYLLGDLFGIHDYAPNGDTLRERYSSNDDIARTLRDVQPGMRFAVLSESARPQVPVVISEFGGITYPSKPDVSPFGGYAAAKTPEELLETYRDLVEALLDCASIAGFCYTQLTDTFQEQNGLLTMQRESKLDPAVVRAITTRPSVALAGHVVAQMRRRIPSPLAQTSEPH